MEQKMFPSKLTVKPDHSNLVKPINVMVGTASNFKGIPEPGDSIKRPLMVNAWAQTAINDFLILNDIENREYQSQRERELEEKVRVLEENLKAHTDLLSQIHATSARTSALLGQQHPSNQQYMNNYSHNCNNGNNFTSSRTSQLSPKIVNAINTTQPVNSSPAESIKYTIIAEGTGNNNDEPIEIQLAEDDGALNLNSSADSGRLEICLAPEENIDIKTECNVGNNATTISPQETSATSGGTPSEQNPIKKRKWSADQHELLGANSKCDEHTTVNSVQHKLPNHKRRSSGNSLLKTPKIENNSNNSSSNLRNISIQNRVTSPISNYNSSYQNGTSDACYNGNDIDNTMVSIGPNNTRIPAKLYENMNWTSASIATRKLLMAIFDRQILATHSMTGKPSPAFKDHGKPIKQMLDPLIIADIIFAVTRKCNVSDKEVRNAITTKCADENKMMKLQMNKRAPMREINKENVVG